LPTYDEVGAPIKLSYTKVMSCTEKSTWLEESNKRSIYGQILFQTSLSSTAAWRSHMTINKRIVKFERHTKGLENEIIHGSLKQRRKKKTGIRMDFQGTAAGSKKANIGNVVISTGPIKLL
jgi:hypothetical protein